MRYWSDLPLSYTKIKFNSCQWNYDESQIFALSNSTIYCWDENTIEIVSILINSFDRDQRLLILLDQIILSLLFVAWVSWWFTIRDMNNETILIPLIKEESYKSNEAIQSDNG
jgi:hypothetical protein